MSRDDELWWLDQTRPALGNLKMLIFARQHIDPRNIGLRNMVPGNHALDFIENRHGVEGCHLRLQVVRFEPNRVTVRLARLRAARLAHVGMCPASERHQSAYVE